MSSKIVTANYISTPQAEALPERALDAIRAAGADNPIILDFDETLFLRNSTEEYLNSIYPRTAGAFFLTGLKALKPWRLLPARLRDDKVSKDWFLVVAVTLLFPWTLLVWRSRAKSLAEKYWNQPLVEALNANSNAQIVIATLGFDLVLKPLLKHLPITLSSSIENNVVACRFWQGAMDRAEGKGAMVTEALGAAAVAKAVAVTDADHDAPLLAKVKTPCLVVWPDAEYVPAMSDVYIPLFYSERVKNPNKAHFVKRVLLGHWAFLAIALSTLSPHPIWNAASLLMLVVSYWCVYEIGYQENDLVGEKYEKKPILSKNYDLYKSRLNLNTPAPWYWATAIALPALLLLEMSKLSLASAQAAFATVTQQGPQLLMLDMTIWIVFLVAVRLTFWLYNQFNEEARIWIYPFLQVQKLFGFTLLLGTGPVGAMLLLSLCASRWLHYAIYRCGGDRWRFPLNLSCLLLFVMLLSSVAIGSPTPDEFVSWQVAIAIVYCTLRAAKVSLETVKRIALVDQGSSSDSQTPTQPASAAAPSAQPSFMKATVSAGRESVQG